MEQARAQMRGLTLLSDRYHVTRSTIAANAIKAGLKTTQAAYTAAIESCRHSATNTAPSITSPEWLTVLETATRIAAEAAAKSSSQQSTGNRHPTREARRRTD